MSSYGSILRNNGGYFIFPLDDAYIHLSIARNFASHGTFGINPGEYDSSSSAPLWTALLSFLFRFGGINQKWALALAFTSGVLLLVVTSVLLFRIHTTTVTKIIVCGLMVFAAPMPLLAISGMEPLLHTTLILLIVFGAAQTLSRHLDALPGPGWTCVLIVIATLVRFETVFLTATLTGFLFAQKRWRLCICVCLAGSLPILMTGAISVSHGWFWLPASVLVKSQKASATTLVLAYGSLGFRLVRSAARIPHLLVLLAGMVGVYLYGKRKPWRPDGVADWMLLISICLFALHLQFAATGSVMRYEAYLVTLGVIVVSIALDGMLRRRTVSSRAMSIVLAFCFLPLLSRGYEALDLCRFASHNIFQQQFQVAQFLKANYSEASVGVNDIGAVTFFADIRCLDLAGLANLPIARAILHWDYATPLMLDQAEKRAVRIAAVYDSWFDGRDLPRLPGSWLPVETWTVDKNFVLGASSVTFYGTNQREAAELSAHLYEFDSKLPVSVTVSRRH